MLKHSANIIEKSSLEISLLNSESTRARTFPTLLSSDVTAYNSSSSVSREYKSKLISLHSSTIAEREGFNFAGTTINASSILDILTELVSALLPSFSKIARIAFSTSDSEDFQLPVSASSIK